MHSLKSGNLEIWFFRLFSEIRIFFFKIHRFVENVEEMQRNLGEKGSYILKIYTFEVEKMHLISFCSGHVSSSLWSNNDNDDDGNDDDDNDN